MWGSVGLVGVFLSVVTGRDSLPGVFGGALDRSVASCCSTLRAPWPQSDLSAAAATIVEDE